MTASLTLKPLPPYDPRPSPSKLAGPLTLTRAEAATLRRLNRRLQARHGRAVCFTMTLQEHVPADGKLLVLAACSASRGRWYAVPVLRPGQRARLVGPDGGPAS